MMVSGYVSTGSYLEALRIFTDMEEAGVKSDAITFTSILMACSQLVEQGKEIDNRIVGSKLEFNGVVVMGALLDMYLVGLGQAFEPLKLFGEMQLSNAKPDIVFVWQTVPGCTDRVAILSDLGVLQMFKSNGNQTKIKVQNTHATENVISDFVGVVGNESNNVTNDPGLHEWSNT
ncbi:choline-phosphate cytidylyltransferase [Sarracenia purpurea var. burkii]